MKRLRQRINLIQKDRDWLNDKAEKYHYMHRAVHQRATPFGWAIEFDGQLHQPDGKPNGFIIFASIHFTCLGGEFGYDKVNLSNGHLIWSEYLPQDETEDVLTILDSWLRSHPECQVETVRLPTKWQVLSLARLWLHDDLPQYSATCVIGKSLKLVQRRWLEVHPPKFLDEPYHIRKVISYADTRFHTGTIYRAANFRESGVTQSQKRHKNTRGEGIGNTDLIRFIYDLKKPNWEYKPLQMRLL